MSASAGTLYFGSQSSTQLFKVDSGGTVSLFGTTASVPYGLTVDTSGNVYAIANGVDEVDKFTPAGTGSIYANNAGAGVLDGNNLAFDLSGYLYTVQNSGQILKIAPGGGSGSIPGCTRSLIFQPFPRHPRGLPSSSSAWSAAAPHGAG